MKSHPVRGEHLKVSRGVYSHHGVYVGDGMVIHYSGEVFEKRGATIRRDLLKVFAAGGAVEIVSYSRCFSGDEAVRRAESRLGENGYSLFGSNCEHFARWCKTGEHSSEQVNDAVAGVAGGSVARFSAIGVSAIGASVGLVITGPAVVAASVGYAAYRTYRWLAA